MDIRPESKKQIESILGQKVTDEALRLLILDLEIAISTHTAGTVIQRHPIFNQPNKCRTSRVLDLSGHALTLDQGENTFRLSDFLCGVNGKFSTPVNILATRHHNLKSRSLLPCSIRSSTTDRMFNSLSFRGTTTETGRRMCRSIGVVELSLQGDGL